MESYCLDFMAYFAFLVNIMNATCIHIIAQKHQFVFIII